MPQERFCGSQKNSLQGQRSNTGILQHGSWCPVRRTLIPVIDIFVYYRLPSFLPEHPFFSQAFQYQAAGRMEYDIFFLNDNLKQFPIQIFTPHFHKIRLHAPEIQHTQGGKRSAVFPAVIIIAFLQIIPFQPPSFSFPLPKRYNTDN